MKRCQLFCLDEQDNIIRSEEFEAEDDADTSERATMHCGEHSVELWAEDHRVSSSRPCIHAPACRRGGPMSFRHS
jgi:hypothetical protein